MPSFADSPALALDTLLAASAAHPDFKSDVLAYAAYEPARRVTTRGQAPRVKVLRVVAQLLEQEPALRVETVRVDGTAGCCDFRGVVTATVDGGERSWEFVWDCRWRAREAGLVDRWGYSDQGRAAREFGWRCFSQWKPRPAMVPAAQLA
jgi:hypothetical protein